ncbi:MULTISPECIES: Wzz/FepE/Etk N-terminal domain-containing protein [Planococcus]|uniref:Polysaccharide chain length determinant N-terminal domain-containing protein n=1 Tax=Planococcus faecalis TaxID=1598147 RepID=A0ABM6IUR4_9BACL|nr:MULTISPECIES: Wzz/FepE/Etk N-terminal domain-containing protein [Planococcus]AQU80084.1 hypothetical protein AJGP001_12710 [Planococcus faecalis]MDJ0330542.1 Wzz/FepE/Etk N-terminal domain-containing protein [Planococcus sp. S3-L1]OHX52537.1 hypothetical protein BB777_03225 [Planococcus faecalis]
MKSRKIIAYLLASYKKQIYFSLSFTFFLMLTASLIFVFIIDSEYQASSQLLVENSQSVLSNQLKENKQIDSRMIEAYAAFIESSEVLDQVSKDLTLKRSVSALRGQILVSYASNSRVLTVTVSSASSQESVSIANAVAAVFQTKVSDSFQTNPVTIISQAFPENGSKEFSQKELLMKIAIAGTFGFISSILLIASTHSVKKTANARDRNIRKKNRQLQTVFK